MTARASERDGVGTRRTSAPGRELPIELSELMALIATGFTLCFQAYYLGAGLHRYGSVFTANLGFLAGFVGVVVLNRTGRPEAARLLVVATATIQIFTVTALIGTGAGVHLFYTTVAISPCLLFPSARPPLMAGLVVVPVGLFLACHHWFPPDRVPLDIPEAVQRWMFAGSAAGTMLFGGMVSLVFRLAIDRAYVAVEASNAELERLASVDGLTGVANRRTLDQRLDQEWQRLHRAGAGATMAVLLCDIDWFKAYNDSHGHQAGDRRLREVAAALSGAARATDLVARYGGEEFCLLLPEADLDTATAVAERARQLVAATGATISVGAAHGGPGELAAPVELVERADRALYDAKAGGRDRVVAWTPSPASAGSPAATDLVSGSPGSSSPR